MNKQKQTDFVISAIVLLAFVTSIYIQQNQSFVMPEHMPVKIVKKNALKFCTIKKAPKKIKTKRSVTLASSEKMDLILHPNKLTILF